MSLVLVEHARVIAAEVFASRWEGLNKIAVPDTHIEAVVGWATGIRNDKRLWGLSQDDHLDQLWEEIRQSITVSDFVMSCTTEFRWRVAGTPEDWGTLCKSLADAFGVFGHEECDVDDDTHTRASNPKALGEVLLGNAWLVFIFVLSTLEMVGV